MDLAQVAELKKKVLEEMRQVEALRLSMNDTIARLSEWEKDLRRSATNSVKTATGKRAAVKEAQPKPKRAIESARLTTSEKINKALTTIRGEFTKAQLLDEAERYGNGLIGAKPFSTMFSKLIKTQRIRCVKGGHNDPDGRYVRSDETKPDHASVA
jgi:hypothetical protein